MTQTMIDETVLKELADTTGADFLDELVRTFLSEAPAMLSDLEAAIAGGDQDGFRRAAHSIKSNASTFGATELADNARALELSGDVAALRVDAAPIAELSASYARAAQALEAFLNG